MVSKSCQKLRQKYFCKKCDYTCRNKYNFDKHLTTTKHKMVTKLPLVKFRCKICQRAYKYRSGLSRHAKKGCQKREPAPLNKSCHPISVKDTGEVGESGLSAESLKILVQTVSHQSSLIEKLIDNQKNMIPKLGSNNNNKISVNVFLKEYCKDAMNLTDFVRNIKISLEDLQYTNQHGYVKGISNIFTKNLTDMKVTERPIHCSDRKRLQFYVKDRNIWEKDTTNEKLDHSIQCITKKQIIQIKQWEYQHPDFLDNEKLTIQWQNMIHNMMGSIEKPNVDKDKEAIRKNISQTTAVRAAIEGSDQIKED